jgi:hypothetical protein
MLLEFRDSLDLDLGLHAFIDGIHQQLLNIIMVDPVRVFTREFASTIKFTRGVCGRYESLSNIERRLYKLL